jgi:hypothetical protein
MTAAHAWALTALTAITLVLGLHALAIGLPLAVSMALIGLLGVSVHAVRPVSAWRGFAPLKLLLLPALFGLLGLLLGLAYDFGTGGLLVLAAWCSARTDLGLGELSARIGLAPWGHVGMLLGCNLGMLLSGCSDVPAVRRGMPLWLFLLLCNLGMLLGMLVLERWQPLPSGGLREVASIMAARMLLAMAVGMAAVWWLLGRLCARRGPVSAPLGEGGNC